MAALAKAPNILLATKHHFGYGYASYWFQHMESMQLLKWLLLVVALVCPGHSIRLHERPRGLVGEPYYWTNDTTVLGVPNATAALGNPLKGLIGGVRWAPPPLPNNVPLSMEW